MCFYQRQVATRASCRSLHHQRILKYQVGDDFIFQSDMALSVRARQWSSIAAKDCIAGKSGDAQFGLSMLANPKNLKTTLSAFFQPNAKRLQDVSPEAFSTFQRSLKVAPTLAVRQRYQIKDGLVAAATATTRTATTAAAVGTTETTFAAA